MALTMADFTEVEGGGYFVRTVVPAEGTDLGRYELIRADGLNLGGPNKEQIADVVKADRAKPAPALDGTIQQLIERPVLLFDAGNPRTSTGIDARTDYSEVYASQAEVDAMQASIVAANTADATPAPADASAPQATPTPKPAPVR